MPEAGSTAGSVAVALQVLLQQPAILGPVGLVDREVRIPASA